MQTPRKVDDRPTFQEKIEEQRMAVLAGILWLLSAALLVTLVCD